jgi:hypothetical protein
MIYVEPTEDKRDEYNIPHKPTQEELEEFFKEDGENINET